MTPRSSSDPSAQAGGTGWRPVKRGEGPDGPRRSTGRHDVVDGRSLGLHLPGVRAVGAHAPARDLVAVQPEPVARRRDELAARWWQARIRRALAGGADGFMQDFGEQVFEDMHFHDGSTAGPQQTGA